MSSARDSTAARTLGNAGVIAALAVGLLFVWFARDVLLLLFAGVLLGVFLRRLGHLVSAPVQVAPRYGVALAVLVIVGVLIGAFWIQGATIAEEVSNLRQELPRALDQLRTRIAASELGARLVDQMPSAPSDLLPDDPDAITRATGVVSRTFSGLASAAIILFLGLVLALGPRPYVQGILALFPASEVPRVREVLSRLEHTIWWWLLGRLVSMAFIGVTTGVGLMLLGVPLAFILGLLAALLSFIPNLGPMLSVVPAAILALVDRPRTALWVLALYAAIQVVESYVLDPVIDKKTVYMPPALTVTAQLLMALVSGLLGVTLATPLVAAMVVMVTMLYVQDVLGRDDVELPAHQ